MRRTNTLSLLVVCIIVVAFATTPTFSQENMRDEHTKYEKFLSRRGEMITKDMYELPQLNSLYAAIDCRVIRLSSKVGDSYYLSMKVPGKYGDKTALVEYNDIIEIRRALVELAKIFEKDIVKVYEYRENFYNSNEGFKIGYYQEGSERKFFIDMAKYQNDDTYFFSDFVPIKKTIESSINQIESIINSK